MDLAFRATTPDDGEFLLQVFASMLGERLAAGGLPVSEWAEMITQQFNAQDVAYRSKFPKADFDVILVDGEKAGRLYLDRRKDELRILDLTLLPTFRGQGIGTKLFEGLFDEARKSSRKIAAHIEHHSRAIGLAHRLGFTPQLETESTTLMVWDPTTVVG